MNELDPARGLDVRTDPRLALVLVRQEAKNARFARPLTWSVALSVVLARFGIVSEDDSVDRGVLRSVAAGSV